MSAQHWRIMQGRKAILSDVEVPEDGGITALPTAHYRLMVAAIQDAQDALHKIAGSQFTGQYVDAGNQSRILRNTLKIIGEKP